MKRAIKTYDTASRYALTAVYYGFIPLVIALGLRSARNASTFA
jgi:hypothetical protein